MQSEDSTNKSTTTDALTSCRNLLIGAALKIYPGGTHSVLDVRQSHVAFNIAARECLLFLDTAWPELAVRAYLQSMITVLCRSSKSVEFPEAFLRHLIRYTNAATHASADVASIRDQPMTF